jgi:hypothetical protein
MTHQTPFFFFYLFPQKLCAISSVQPLCVHPTFLETLCCPYLHCDGEAQVWKGDESGDDSVDVDDGDMTV